MIKKILFSIICICLFSLGSIAEEIYAIDKAEDACISKTSSTDAMLKCTAIEALVAGMIFEKVNA